MKGFLEKPANVKFAGIAVLVLLGLIGYFFVVSPRLSAASEIKLERESVAQQNDVRQAEIAALTEKAENIQEGRDKAEFLVGKFPATAAQADLFAQIRQAAAAAGLAENQVSTLTPSIPQAGVGATDGAVALPGQGGGPGVASMTVSMAATGTFDQLVGFLTNLENMDRAYLIKSVSVAPSGEEGADAYAVTIDGTMFVLPAPTTPEEYDAVMERRAAQAPVVDPNAPVADPAAEVVAE